MRTALLIVNNTYVVELEQTKLSAILYFIQVRQADEAIYTDFMSYWPWTMGEGRL